MRGEALSWLRVARKNLERAEACVFWSQQVVEFALKALSELTPFYSASRYPDVFSGVPEIHPDTAKRFLSFAREVLLKVEEAIRGNP